MHTNKPPKHTHIYSCVCVCVLVCQAVAAKYATGNFQFHAPSSFTFIAHCPCHAHHTPAAFAPEKERGWPERKIELFIWLRLSYLKLFYVPLSQRKLFLHQKRERVQELEKERETKRRVGGRGEEIEQLECETFSLPCAGKGCCSCGSCCSCAALFLTCT